MIELLNLTIMMMCCPPHDGPNPITHGCWECPITTITHTPFNTFNHSKKGFHNITKQQIQVNQRHNRTRSDIRQWLKTWRIG